MLHLILVEEKLCSITWEVKLYNLLEPLLLGVDDFGQRRFTSQPKTVSLLHSEIIQNLAETVWTMIDQGNNLTGLLKRFDFLFEEAKSPSTLDAQHPQSIHVQC